jgi:hypothetical protein
MHPIFWRFAGLAAPVGPLVAIIKTCAMTTKNLLIRAGAAAWYQVSGTRYLVPGIWYQVPGTWLVPGTWYQVPATWYLVPGTCSSAFVLVHRGTWAKCLFVLAGGSKKVLWYLVPGTWYLVPGTWYLVPGTLYLVPAEMGNCLTSNYHFGDLEAPFWVPVTPFW